MFTKNLSNSGNNVDLLKEKLNLLKHPEGGYFVQFYKSSDEVSLEEKSRYDGEKRAAGTSIYYLLENEDFSAWHTLASDEIWHFYNGSTIKIYTIDPKGNLNTHLLGNALLEKNANFQVMIKAGDWFCAEVVDKNSYALVGCTVSPGFEFNDFRLAKTDEMISQFPQHETIIRKFTINSINTIEREKQQVFSCS